MNLRGQRLKGTAYRDRSGVYTWKDVRFTSVTTVLRQLAKPALPNWAAKCVAEYVAERANLLACHKIKGGELLMELLDVDRMKSVPWRIKEDKANLGTTVHDLAQSVVSGDKVSPDAFAPDLREYVKAFLDWHDQYHPEYIAMEAAVFSRKHAYAGTMDAIVKLNGRTLVLDYKTAKDSYPEHALQLAAYRGGEFIGLQDGTEEPMPQTVGGAILVIQPGGCRLVEWPCGTAEFDVFRSLIPVSEWAMSKPKPIDAAAGTGRF